MTSQAVTFGQTVSLSNNAFSRAGYTFAGWSTTSGGEVEYNDGASYTHSIPENRNLYAIWNPNIYRVYFNANGGTGSMSYQEVPYEQYIALNPNTFNRSGYGFAGWAESSNGDVVYFSNNAYRHEVMGNTTLYAVWVSVPMKQVPVSGSITFPVGWNDSSTSTINYSYLVGETPVTYRLWKAVMAWAKSYDRGDSRYYIVYGMSGSAWGSSMHSLNPVTYFYWREGMVWCNALTEWHNAVFGTNYTPVYQYQGSVIRDSSEANADVCNNAVQTANNGFRLLTSDEWELAARWRTNSTNTVSGYSNPWFTHGDSASGATADTYDTSATGLVAWYDGNTSSTQPVGGKNPNSLGIYDMSGNVREWCFTLSGSSRIRRGGAWELNAHSTRIGSTYSSGDFGGYTTGLRVARTP
jgi:formylglycine-generating enzyme